MAEQAIDSTNLNTLNCLCAVLVPLHM